jgi:ribonuclease BN (tRNA processing enzyme)
MQPRGTGKYTHIIPVSLKAMKVTFIGTGDCCDPFRRNLSVLLEDNNHRHLLDCGFSSTHGYLAYSPDLKLDTIWISHFHGDHFFGVPQLIAHFYMLKRNEPLTVISGVNGEDKILQSIDLAYPKLTTKLPFSLKFFQLQPGMAIEQNDLIWKCAPVLHSQPAFGLRISNGRQSLYYSGDGKFTEESSELMKRCDLVIHEAFSVEPSDPNHSSIKECMLVAKKLDIQRLALVHLNQETRQTLNTCSAPLQKPESTEIIIPQDGDTLLL